MPSSGPPFTQSRKTKPSPPPQPYETSTEEEEEEEEEEEGEEEEEEEEEEKNPLPLSPQSEQHDENADASSDNENIEEKPDQDLERTKQKSQPPVGSSALDEERKLVLATYSGSSPLPPPLSRIWQEPMQLLLLREMVDYSKINGKCKISISYVSKFHASLESSPLHKFSVNQILEKMRSFKKRYDGQYGMGKGKRKGNPFNPELLELLRKLWGEAGKGQGRKRKRLKVEDVENGGDDDVDDNEGDHSAKGTTVWENAMVRLMEETFSYQEDYTRQKIASLDKSTRDLLEKRWLIRKGKLNAAIVNFGCVENACLKALLLS